jgi:NADH-quinone oxidoreductase subunit M
MLETSLLSVVSLLPLVAALALVLLDQAAKGAGRELGASTWKVAGLVASLATFAISLKLWTGYDPTIADYQFVEHEPWLAEWGVNYYVGIDGISLLLILLTTFLQPLVLLASWNDIQQSVKSYVFFMLALETGMIATFAALNLFQFYLFWELMLIPMYFIIGIWGGPRRVYAAIKFFLFTMVGSLLMLVSMLVVYRLHFEQTGTYTLDLIAPPGGALPGLLDTNILPAGDVWWRTQPWLFAAFALAFGIKVPVFPFHTWLPDAHVEAPTAGSVILAGVLLKMGTYGFVRFALPLFPDAAVQFAPFVFGLGLAGILYGALVAMVQKDIKKLVAYSSIAHLGFVMLGTFALNDEGLKGAVLQMVNHGLSTGALFLLVGMIYERRHTREISAFGGIAKPMPVYAALFGIVTMSSIGLPALNGFVGEYLILLGTFHAAPRVAVAATFGVVLAAVYMLWMYRRVMFGPVEIAENRGLIDLDLREKLVIAAVVIPILWIGVYPQPLLTRLNAPIGEILRVMQAKRAPAASADSAPLPLPRQASVTEPAR